MVKGRAVGPWLRVDVYVEIRAASRGLRGPGSVLSPLCGSIDLIRELALQVWLGRSRSAGWRQQLSQLTASGKVVCAYGRDAGSDAV